MWKTDQKTEDEVREVPCPNEHAPEDFCANEHWEAEEANNVGLGILLATVLVATVICSVGFATAATQTVHITEDEMLRNDVKWIKSEMANNWMPQLKELSMEVAKLKRIHKELEVENVALRRGQRLAAGE